MKKTITAVKALRTGYGAVQTVKSGIDAVCHPIQWAKDQLIGAVKSMLLKQLKKELGEAAAHTIINRLDIEGKTYPLTLNIPVTKPLRKAVQEDFLELVESITNDALRIPLQALGYRLVSVEFSSTGGERNDENRRSENVEFSTKGEKHSDENLKYDEERYILTAKIHVGLLRLDRAIPAQEKPVLSAKENSVPTLV